MAESVVITGGGNSVGREMAERFLARGDRVHICDVDPAYLAATLEANPGMINNERMRGIIKRNADAAGKTEKAIEDEYLQFISMRTKIEPSEIADMVLFLASPAARKVSGELISVSGNVEWEI
jgi:NAD(P)-dependent dehydrogenase (short-subunit alcohol dehydrogenase family)